MGLTRLGLRDFRCFAEADLTLSPGVSVIFGENAAGKTSLLEAIYLLSHGRSFRAARAEEITRRGADNFRIFLETREEASGTHRLGLQRSGVWWRARIEGVDASLLSQLIRHIPLVLIEPKPYHRGDLHERVRRSQCHVSDRALFPAGGNRRPVIPRPSVRVRLRERDGLDQ